MTEGEMANKMDLLPSNKWYSYRNWLIRKDANGAWVGMDCERAVMVTQAVSPVMIGWMYRRFVKTGAGLEVIYGSRAVIVSNLYLECQSTRELADDLLQALQGPQQLAGGQVYGGGVQQTGGAGVTAPCDCRAASDPGISQGQAGNVSGAGRGYPPPPPPPPIRPRR